MSLSRGSLTLQQLIDVWATLETLTVSLERIGSYERNQGHEAAMKALNQYFSPSMVQRISHARRIITDIIIEQDAQNEELLEQLAEDETAINYWQGPVIDTDQ